MHSFRDSALETFDKALQIDPKYAPAYLYRGQVLYEQKQDYAGAGSGSWRWCPRARTATASPTLVARAKGKQPAR